MTQALPGPRFFAVLGVAVLLAAMTPALWPFVLAGAAVGLLALPAARYLRGRRLAWAAAAAGLAAAAGIAVALSGAGDGGGAPGLPQTHRVELGAAWHADAQWRRDPERLAVRETLTTLASDLYADGTTPYVLVNRAMRASGWSLDRAATTDRRVVFARTRIVPVASSSTLPAEETTLIETPDLTMVPTGPPGMPRDTIVIVPAASSALVIRRAPERAIASTWPPPLWRQTHPAGGEDVAIALPDDASPVELGVRSAAFRTPVLATASDLTLWTPFRWLLGLLIPLANGAVVAALKRVFARKPRPAPETERPPARRPRRPRHAVGRPRRGPQLRGGHGRRRERVG